MADVSFNCAHCGGLGQKPRGEFNRSRKMGRPQFCSRGCAAKSANAPRRSKEITLSCPGCGDTFVTTTHNKAKKHCSRSCASKASMSEERRDAQRLGGLMQTDNLLTAAETLKRREGWKYAALREVLLDAKREFEFEFELGDRVFDLALLDTRVLVEFDGPYHTGDEQLADDEDKDQAAKDAGFTVLRRQVLPAMVIDPQTLEGL